MKLMKVRLLNEANNGIKTDDWLLRALTQGFFMV
jgi:hypothetical protein